ncbi:hypothetical protein Tiera_014 [Polaromonas phage Tiera]|nr:hypothetical protein Tiera_014 [Polaromonas phage Tiera]
MSFHGDLTILQGIHSVQAWEVADAAARAAVVPGPADVGKILRQLDTDSFYLLEDSGPAKWNNLSATPDTSFIIPVACSDEFTPLAIAPGQVTFVWPEALNILAVHASLTTAQGSGGLVTVDANIAGVSIFTTRLTIDNGEFSTGTATTPAVLNATPKPLAAFAKLSIDVDVVGSGEAAGLKLYFKVQKQ